MVIIKFDDSMALSCIHSIGVRIINKFHSECIPPSFMSIVYKFTQIWHVLIMSENVRVMLSQRLRGELQSFSVYLKMSRIRFILTICDIFLPSSPLFVTS